MTWNAKDLDPTLTSETLKRMEAEMKAHYAQPFLPNPSRWELFRIKLRAWWERIITPRIGD